MPASNTQPTLAQRLGLTPHTPRPESAPLVSEHLVRALLARHERDTLPRLTLLWSYYRNPLQSAHTINGAGGLAGRGYRLAQERGLPQRVVGAAHTRGPAAAIIDDRYWSRKEVVIENDIAWRINTMVDFMFGRPVRLSSTAKDPALRAQIERLLSQVFEQSGGASLMQDIGILGHVYGHVDLIVRIDPSDTINTAPSDGEPSGELPTPRESGDERESVPAPSGGTGESGPASESAQKTTTDSSAHIATERAVSRIWIQAVDPTRGVGLPGAGSNLGLDVYIHRFDRATRTTEEAINDGHSVNVLSALRRWWRAGAGIGSTDTPAPKVDHFIEVFADGKRQVFRTDGNNLGERIDDAPALVSTAAGDTTPIVRIQNIPLPGHLDGLSEVEPLVPLQDELNTRLSDRASRVTFASFKMFLCRNIDGAETLPVGPGQVWSTDNDDASIQMFGGDADSPSEDQHIQEIREAMDKISSVPPVAGGVVQAKIGNLSSENALRITLMGLLSKTARKRLSYRRGFAQACAIILEALDRMGALKTAPADRTVRVDWTDPLQRDELTALTIAEKKLALGVPRERVLAELGYGPGDPGVV